MRRRFSSQCFPPAPSRRASGILQVILQVFRVHAAWRWLSLGRGVESCAGAENRQRTIKGASGFHDCARSSARPSAKRRATVRRRGPIAWLQPYALRPGSPVLRRGASLAHWLIGSFCQRDREGCSMESSRRRAPLRTPEDAQWSVSFRRSQEVWVCFASHSWLYCA